MKPWKFILSILAIVASWLLAGIAFTTTLGHPMNTVILFCGFVAFFGGIIGAIVWRPR